MSVRIKKPIAQDIVDLSRAKVHQSELFAVTNVSGAVLAAAAVVLTVGGAGAAIMGGLQFQAPTDTAIPLLAGGIGSAVGGIIAGLTSQWLGTIDDNAIDEHNRQSLRSRMRSAASKKYEDVQAQLVDALQDVNYNPATGRLPNDVLGYLTIMPDKLLEKLPAHIRLDTYRTQADLMLFKYAGLCAHESVEGTIIEERTMQAKFGMDEKADIYRQMRNYIHEESSRNTLVVTPLPTEMRGRHVNEKSGYTFDDFMSDLADAMPQSSSYRTRSRNNNDDFVFWPTGNGGSSNHSSGGITGTLGTRTSDGFRTGGGFGGEGFKTGGTMAAVPLPIPAGDSGVSDGGLMDAFGGAGGGSLGSNKSSSDNNDDAVVALFIVVAIAVVAVAATVVTNAVHKNYFKRAAVPHLNGVDLPVMTRSLKGIRSEIDKMYNRRIKNTPVPGME